MFWRFASHARTTPVRQVLLVNRAEIVESTCDSCRSDLVSDAGGGLILVAGPDDPNDLTHHYCSRCGDDIWVPTLSGRRLKRYSLDWAMPLQSAPGALRERKLSTHLPPVEHSSQV